MLSRTLAAVVLAAAPIALSPIAAQEPVRTARVSFADLNLSTASGRAALDRRVRHTAAQVCAEPIPNYVPMLMKERQCMKAAVANVVRQVAALSAPQIATR